MNSSIVKLPITVVTAVMNESVNLPAFLEHVTKLFDEIIIVIDARSTDDSDEIAKKYDCKIIYDRGESGGIVFYNKNRGAKEARNQWVFILDADERVSPELLTEITNLTTGKLSTSATVFQTSFLNYEFGKLFESCDQKYKPFVRLFQKGKFSYKIGSTAEGFGIQTSSLGQGNRLHSLLLKLPVVRSLLLQNNPDIYTFQGSLIHNSHPTLDDFVNKINFYSTRESRILFSRHPSKPHFFLVLNLFTQPLKEFIYKFFVWRFYKEGVHGLVASMIYGFYHFLIHAKYFALVYASHHQSQIGKFTKTYGFGLNQTTKNPD